MSSSCSTSGSGVCGRPALYVAARASRNFASRRSNATAIPVGDWSSSSLASMEAKPKTAWVCWPEAVASCASCRANHARYASEWPSRRRSRATVCMLSPSRQVAGRRNVALGADWALDDLLRALAHRGPLVHRRLLDEREGLGLPHAFLVHELALGPVDP